MNLLAALGGIQYYVPADTPGAVTVPSVNFTGGVADTVPATLNFGILNSKYLAFVNAGTGLAALIGGPDTTLVSGQHATTLFINQSERGEAYLGGGTNLLGNAFASSKLSVIAEGGEIELGQTFGSATLILDDSAGGSMDVVLGAGLLTQLYGGGSDSLVAQSGVVAVLGARHEGSGSGVATVSAMEGAQVWVGAQGGALFITPGAGDAFVFQGVAGTENSATLFGGSRTFAGQRIDASAFTGRATVLGMNGWLESGSAGGSVLQSGTTEGAATLVAGGANDILFLRAANDTAILGDAPGVLASAANSVTQGNGDTFVFGAGSGTVFGAANGHNRFLFQGAGQYTVAGFHQTSDTTIIGSAYRNESTGPGGAGHITIVDFFVDSPASPVRGHFDTFDIGNASISSIVSTPLTGLSSAFYDNTVSLSDGTVVTFLATYGAINYDGVRTLF